MTHSLQFYLPIGVIVFCNVFYHICTKAVPAQINPFFTLVVTYIVGAAFALILFFATSPSKDLLLQAKALNWAPFILGLTIVGLEVGFIFLYRVGWNISIGSLVCNIALSIILIFVGILLYKEVLTVSQIIGIVLCIGGLVFINK